MRYPPAAISKVKGLYKIGLSVKEICSGTGLEFETVRGWCYLNKRKDVEPDPAPKEWLQQEYTNVVALLNAENAAQYSRDNAPNANVPAASEAKPSDTLEPGSP